MKAYKYIPLVVLAGSLWSCSSSQVAQQPTEYDDLYFSSADRKAAATYTASASGNNYAVDNLGEKSEDYSQKNVNPEYIQQYAEQGKKRNNQQEETYETNNSDSYSADNTYYDENYQRRGGVNLARGYNQYYNNDGYYGNTNPGIVNNFYGGAGFYDPFYGGYGAFYDPFYRPRFRSGWGLSLGFGNSWGWGNPWGWNSFYGNPYAGFYDPFYNPYRSGFWGDPFYGNYYGGWNSWYGWNRPWYGGGNVIIVNPDNGSNGRTVRYSPRNARSSSVVNDRFDNSPRSNRAVRGNDGGRFDNSTDNRGGRTSTGVISDGNRPARAVRPRSDSPQNYDSQTGNNDRNAAPVVIGSGSSPRAVRPRSNNTAPQYDNRRNNTYFENNSSNQRNSVPSYSAPSSGRSPRSFDSSPRNSGFDNSGSNSSFGSGSRGSSSGSFSSPRSSGGGGGSRSPRSPR